MLAALHDLIRMNKKNRRRRRVNFTETSCPHELSRWNGLGAGTDGTDGSQLQILLNVHPLHASEFAAVCFKKSEELFQILAAL